MRPIYYDTETTGTRSEHDRIIEIAAFDATSRKEFCHLIHPGIPIPQEATAIHGITDEMVKNAPSFKEIAPLFIDFCQPDAVLIAHNNDAFDRLFLEAEFARAQLPIPSFRYIDSLKWARKYRPDLPRHALQFLREVYGIPTNQAHRALDDVHVLHRVFSSMIDDLDLSIVMELLSQAQVPRMPFGKYKGRLFTEVPLDYFKWLDSSGALSKSENAHLRDYFLSQTK